MAPEARGQFGPVSRLFVALVAAGVVVTLWNGPAARPRRQPVADRIRDLQVAAESAGRASWGHWGDRPEKYDGWSNHSNRLIPVYTFGCTLESVTGTNSVYRSAAGLEKLYGRLPDRTLAPTADYCDQTDVHRLQRSAVEQGARRVILVVFDGMDWTLTRTAAIAHRGRVAYDAGRGAGLPFQDYAGVVTDFGLCVTSPANDGTRFDPDAQVVTNPGGTTAGGYDPSRGGPTPWTPAAALPYLIGKDRECPHAVTDSAAAATALCTGRKTYNDAINVGPGGEPLVPLARELQAAGWAVGAVTSVPVSHATPACSYANNVTRDDYQDIARDLLGEPSIAHRDAALPGLDVLLGAGWGEQAVPAKEKDQGANLERGNKYVADSTRRAVDVAHGGRYVVAERTPGRRGRDVLAAAVREAIDRRTRLFGFFGATRGNLPFQTADGDFDPAAGRPAAGPGVAEPLKGKYGGPIRYTRADIDENPSLADLAVAALDLLGRRERFWLMVEAGDVDWAAHANNIDTCIGAVKSGAAAFRAIVDWIEAHGGWQDTVVIVTSDHGHLFVLTDPAAFAG